MEICGRRQVKKEIVNVLCHGTGGVLSSAASVILSKEKNRMFNLLKDIDSYQFWEGAKQNKLLIQQSTKSKNIFYIQDHIWS